LIPLPNLTYSQRLRAIKFLSQKMLLGIVYHLNSLAKSLIVNMNEADIKDREDSEGTSQVEEVELLKTGFDLDNYLLIRDTSSRFLITVFMKID
jgi:hypothetical protein